MRIAQISPLYERVPPRLYGGTERVVSFLTEELVRLGHDVTLFASGDSITRAELVPVCPRALRLDDECRDPLAHHIVLIDQVLREAARFDVLHFHVDYLHYPFSRRLAAPHVTTLHGRLDIPDLVPLYRQFSAVPVVSISNAQRLPLPHVNWQATVHHGLPTDLYSFRPRPDNYLAFLGRISPEKRPDRAIEIARRTGIPLVIAAKVDRADRDYYESVIKPLLNGPLVEFIGEIDEARKPDFLGGALALLFPIDWPEPFGLVMVEAMACGTPVIAMRRGSVPEIVEDGKTGCVCDDVDAAVAAVERLADFDRARCRREFEKRFTATRMATDYVRVYECLCETHERHGRDHPGQRPVLRPGHVATRR